MKNILIIILLFITNSMWSQTIEKQVIGTLGGDYSNGNRSVNATAGEAIVQTFTSGSFILLQGFQQANNENVSVEEIEIDANYKLYPNPTTNATLLEITSVSQSTTVTVNVYSPLGSIIQSNIMSLEPNSKSSLSIDLSNQSNGMYFVEIVDSSNKMAQKIKVIKQ